MAMTTENKRKIASILFVLISLVCVAQDLPSPMPTPPPGFPIDSGVLIGAFVALCYGVKKLLKNN
jgi:hypothetical protein